MVRVEFQHALKSAIAVVGFSLIELDPGFDVVRFRHGGHPGDQVRQYALRLVKPLEQSQCVGAVRAQQRRVRRLAREHPVEDRQHIHRISTLAKLREQTAQARIVGRRLRDIFRDIAFKLRGLRYCT